MKMLDFLRKIGVFRSGFVSGSYKSGKDRPIEFMMDDVVNSKKDLVTKKDLKNAKEVVKKNGGFLFWISLIIGGFLLLVMLIGSGFSFWFLIVLALWVFFLRKLKIGGLVLWKGVVILFSISLLTFLIIGATYSDEKDSLNSSNDKAIDQEDSNSVAEFDDSASAKILRDLAEATGIKFSSIEKTEFNWTTKDIELKMVNPRKFSAKEVSQKELKEIKDFFADGGWNDGGQFFRFVKASGSNETGFAAPYNSEYQAAMCVVGEKDGGVKVKCGFGPGGEDK